MYDFAVEITEETSSLVEVEGAQYVVEIVSGSNTVTGNQEPTVETVEIIVPGPPGPQGPPGAVGLGYQHHQAIPAATWLITHNLGRKPDCALFVEPDLTERVWTDIRYVDSNTLTVVWPSAISGWAYL